MVKSALTSLLNTSVALQLNATLPVICYSKMNFYIGIFKYLYWDKCILIWLFHEHKCFPSKQGHHVTGTKCLKLLIYSIYFSGFWKKNCVFKLSALGHGIYFLCANLKVFFSLFLYVMAPGFFTVGLCRVRKKSSFAVSIFRGLTPINSGLRTKSNSRAAFWSSSSFSWCSKTIWDSL